VIAEKNKAIDLYYVLSLAGQIGYTIAIPLLFFIAGGAFLDKKLHTSPMLVLSGLIIGIITSLFFLYKLLKPLLKSKKNKKT
jgi:ATP synthase protein I